MLASWFVGDTNPATGPQAQFLEGRFFGTKEDTGT
jgi:hypothetical protein